MRPFSYHHIKKCGNVNIKLAELDKFQKLLTFLSIITMYKNK